jgi:hypothetical protein
MRGSDVLEPDQRVVLLDQLRPPPGYRLQAGVATTFTLDLESALVPPLAFASFETRDAIDPIAALQAVRSCTERVDIFCQAGQVVVPRQHSDVLASLEPMVHPVRSPRPGFLFHPKVWFLHFVGDDDLPDRFRLICSTRNLTDSHAWDAAITLDGVAARAPRAANRSLAALIAHLPRLAVAPLAPERSERITSLANLASRVEWELPDGAKEVAFHAFGVPRFAASPDFRGYNHLIVSPFCNDAGLAQITAGARGPVTLVSTSEALDGLSPGAVALDTFVLDPLAVLDVSEDGGGVDTLSGLHAKVIVLERERLAHVFIGSANATSAAYGGNVEFVVELVGGASKLGVGAFVEGIRPLLVEYEAGSVTEPDPADDLLRTMLGVLRRVAEVAFEIVVSEPNAAGNYRLCLTSEKTAVVPSGYRLDAELLSRLGRSVDLGDAEVCFDDVPLLDVTPFVVLRLTDVVHSTASAPVGVATVVHARLVGDPAGRLDAALARQVDTPEKFLRFTALLLGVSQAPGIGEAFTAAGESAPWRTGATAGLFELLVEALATRPEALRDLDRLVERLQCTEAGRAVLPEGFVGLWESVRAALTTLTETP